MVRATQNRTRRTGQALSEGDVEKLLLSQVAVCPMNMDGVRHKLSYIAESNTNLGRFASNEDKESL